MLAISEQVTRFTPLGIRFWDPLTDRQVSDGLTVQANPVGRPEKRISAFQTKSQVYAFSGLPGLGDIEDGTIDPLSVPPTDRKSFIVNVQDRLNRYLDVSFAVRLPLPYLGTFLSEQKISPFEGAPPGLYLYSSVSRRLQSRYALVRGNLLDRDLGLPASHALLKLHTDDGEVWFGIADAEGRFVLGLPFPSLGDGFGGSPASTQIPLHQQSWEAELEVCYAPSHRETFPGASVPSYVSLLNQSAAEVFPVDPDASSSTVTRLPVSLQFQRATVVRSEGVSNLIVSPISS